ncbi:MAG: ankyrin repeat domain-containing protein [Bacteroidota bacterium]
MISRWKRRRYRQRCKRLTGACNEASLVKIVEMGEEKILAGLLDQGFSPDSRDEQGVPAIVQAMLSGQDGCMQLLLDAQADLNASDATGNTALMYAIQQEELSWVHQPLIEAQDLEIQNQAGETVLHIACRSKRTSLVGTLLNKGVSANIQDQQGNTPLLLAAKAGKTGMIKMLIAAGANPLLMNQAGLRPHSVPELSPFQRKVLEEASWPFLPPEERPEIPAEGPKPAKSGLHWIDILEIVLSNFSALGLPGKGRNLIQVLPELGKVLNTSYLKNQAGLSTDILPGLRNVWEKIDQRNFSNEDAEFQLSGTLKRQLNNTLKLLWQYLGEPAEWSSASDSAPQPLLSQAQLNQALAEAQRLQAHHTIAVLKALGASSPLA